MRINEVTYEKPKTPLKVKGNLKTKNHSILRHNWKYTDLRYDGGGGVRGHAHQKTFEF